MECEWTAQCILYSHKYILSQLSSSTVAMIFIITTVTNIVMRLSYVMWFMSYSTNLILLNPFLYLNTTLITALFWSNVFNDSPLLNYKYRFLLLLASVLNLSLLNLPEEVYYRTHNIYASQTGFIIQHTITYMLLKRPCFIICRPIYLIYLSIATCHILNDMILS